MASCGGPFGELPAAAEQEDETEDMETSEDLDQKLSTLLEDGVDDPQPPEPGMQFNRHFGLQFNFLAISQLERLTSISYTCPFGAILGNFLVY